MEFRGSVAAITGAAGGIGFALAQEAVRRGMAVVLSDIREDALEAARKSLSELGGDVLAVRADVTSSAEVEALASAAVERFGKVNLLINNAGAFVASLAWETPEAQLDWILDLNVKSIAHGIRAFVPRMIAQGDPCHVVTVASAAAITVYPGYATYSTSKHAALALTEALYMDLAAEEIDSIGVTIAMPTIIQTDIMSPEKASPAALALAEGARFRHRTVRAMEQMMRNHVASGHAMGADEVARQTFDAIAGRRLYVLPGHDGEADVAKATSIAVGRASGTNPYPPILDAILQSIGRAETTAAPGHAPA
ncbi:SDR family NAD(P)-dependent oxidoreductase [Sphingomonas solaris]|uniref:SDR family NAD(P)-dependent oxidoreductase n=1 Tax=Alterirhizorhabdus solaris TaxID=2529389 RepID=A0A558R835_9SPHN|nr:SDR family NAD(P)-dependent oxidoreductase [Sphingomonas solaris]TVV75462.1 SDR family NAD(P)-dependent oxidoreductase [Sphingomonas solaris]